MHNVFNKKKTIFSLIAFSLERFSKELKEKYSKFSKPKKLSQHSIYNRISSNFLYLRNAKSISDYVRVRKKSDKMNPIKVRVHRY